MSKEYICLKHTDYTCEFRLVDHQCMLGGKDTFATCESMYTVISDKNDHQETK